MSGRVLLGVCGGVAAYRAAELLRALQREGCEVRVMMTKSAAEFVKPLTFASLSGHKVYTGLWENGAEAAEIEHIAAAQWADVVVIAPTTANTLAKLTHGIADDFLTCACLATQAPLLLAPAMNVNMWTNAATQANVQTLASRGAQFVEPENGYLACGMTGGGRLAEVETIVRAVMAVLQPVRDLAGETVLVTAGGTREPVDAVRFLGNRSSGRMGYAIAAAAARRGARVLLVSAPASLPVPAGCELISVTTSAEMRDAVLSRLDAATVVVKAAAVSDFRVASPATGKLERSAGLTLELEPTEDIARAVVQQRKPGTLVIAFAAEVGMDVARARAKMERKGVDAIVLNDIAREGVGFDAERNAAVFLTRDASVELPESSKDALADRLLDQVVLLRSRMLVTA